MAKKIKPEVDISSEEKIKEAARKVFTRKGYAATRTRDIAEEAGINLALLNYYFRSKEKLFHLIMLEKVQKIFSILIPTLNDRSLTLDEKIQRIVDGYIEMIALNPDLPIFVLTEIRNNINDYADQLQIRDALSSSHFMEQLKERKSDVNVFHFIINFFALILFPFIAKPMLEVAANINEAEMKKLIEERKTLIPIWLELLL